MEKKNNQPIQHAVAITDRNTIKDYHCDQIIISKKAIQMMVDETNQISLPTEIMQALGLSDSDDVVFIKKDDDSMFMRKA